MSRRSSKHIKEKKKLKSCPFCGAEPDVVFAGNWYIRCNYCKTLFGYDILYGGIYETEEEAIDAWNSERITGRIKQNILNNDVVIGHYVLTEFEGDCAYLSDFEIQKDYRGKGYGTKLLKTLSKKYKRLYVAPDNNRCRSLYERLGLEASPEEIPAILLNCAKQYGTIYIL